MAVAVLQAASKAQELYEATSWIVGQERARKEMASILEGQWRLAHGEDDHRLGAVLLGGRSGTGKSAMARAMCSHLGLPFAETDATRFAEVGYRGLQMSQMFIPLLSAAARMIDGEKPPERADALFKREDLGEVVALAQTGVVLFDEFDKWMARVNHVTGQRDTAIQSELLKLIEGSVEFVTNSDDEVGVPFDSSKVLIICAGAFVNLYHIVRRRLEEDADVKAQQMNDAFWNAIVPEDFERFGLLPELTGRLTRHVFTRPLRQEHLQGILCAPDGLLAYYRDRYESYGVRWQVSAGGITHLVGQAMQHETGARALGFVTNRIFGGQTLYDASVAQRPLALIYEVGMPHAELRPL